MDRLDLSDDILSADAWAELVSPTRSLLEASIALKQQVMETQAEVIVRMAEAIFQSLVCPEAVVC